MNSVRRNSGIVAAKSRHTKWPTAQRIKNRWKNARIHDKFLSKATASKASWKENSVTFPWVGFKPGASAMRDEHAPTPPKLSDIRQLNVARECVVTFGFKKTNPFPTGNRGEREACTTLWNRKHIPCSFAWRHLRSSSQGTRRGPDGGCFEFQIEFFLLMRPFFTHDILFSLSISSVPVHEGRC